MDYYCHDHLRRPAAFAPMLRSKILANFLGAGYGMLLQFLMVPVTLHYLGPQAYGLVGIYSTLLAILAVLDFGLAPALTRELSRLSVTQGSNHLMRPTVTTLELIGMASAATVGAVIWFSAPLLAGHWFTNTALSTGVVQHCLQWLGVQSAFHFLANYYTAGLVGLQRITLCNVLAAVSQTARTVALLWALIAWRDIEVYFICQAVMGFLNLVAVGVALYAVLPKDDAAKPKPFHRRYSHERLISCRAFAGGMAATAVTTLALTQLDKIILSKMLSLEQFGYYTIATSIASLLTKPASLVLGAVLPRMTQLAVGVDVKQLAQVYFRSSALVGWLVLPAAGIVIGFAQPLLNLYLKSTQNAQMIAPLLAALAAGHALHALTFVPYGLTLAYGWAQFGVKFGAISSIALVPLIILATQHYGALGAAGVWGLLCLSYVTIFMIVIHNRYLLGHLRAWYFRVCLAPGLLCAGLICLGLFVTRS